MTIKTFEDLKIGDEAPDFTLPSGTRELHKLSDYRGRMNIVLAFYVLDFTGGCETELGALEKQLTDLHEHKAQVISISCDAAPSHNAFAMKLGGISFPMLSDFHPHGEVSRRYGVYNDSRGTPLRATYIIDLDGKVRWKKLYESVQGVLDVEEIIRELEKLK